MKVKLNMGTAILLILLGIFPAALHVSAGCNPPPGISALTLSITGPSVVKVGANVTYTLTGTDAVAGDYVWTYSDFIVVGSATGVSIDLTAPATESASMDDQKIECTFTPTATDWTGSCSKDKDVTVAKLEFKNVSISHSSGYTMPSSCQGSGSADGLVDQFETALDNLSSEFDMYDPDLEEYDPNDFLDAVNNFIQTCQSISSQASGLSFSSSTPSATPLNGAGSFTLRCLPTDLTTSGTITPSVKTWQSTKTFGEDLWKNFTPTTFSGGDTAITFTFNGNYGVMEIEAIIGAATLKEELSAVTGPEEETLINDILSAFNTEKARIDGKKQTVANIDDGVSIIAGYFSIIPIVGDLAAANFNTAKIIAKNALISSYNREAAANLDQAKKNLIETEEFPQSTPTGGDDASGNCNTEAARLESGN